MVAGHPSVRPVCASLALLFICAGEVVTCIRVTYTLVFVTHVM